MPHRAPLSLLFVLALALAVAACGGAPAQPAPTAAPQPVVATQAAPPTQAPVAAVPTTAPTMAPTEVPAATEAPAVPSAAPTQAAVPTLEPKPFLYATIPAPSLANNLLGDPAEQNAYIYLPPSYFSGNQRYPVLYYLTGFGDREMIGFVLPTAMDDLIKAGKTKEMIIVVANGVSKLGGSFYVNSPVTGNWEDYVTKDLVGYVDANLRTLPNAASRGITGHSMGGFGALNLAMHHPDLFSAVYAFSPGLFDPNGMAESQMFDDETKIESFIKTAADLGKLPKEEAADEMSSVSGDDQFTLAYGAAFAPDPANPPFLTYPYQLKDGKPVRDDTVWQTWEAGYGGIKDEAVKYADNWRKLKAITVECGKNDNYKWIPKGCTYFAEQMKAAGIPVELTMTEGGHESTLGQGIGDRMLPFFSRLLAFQ